MAVRDSVQYDNLHVKKFLADARDRAGRAVPLSFAHTVVTGEAIADDVNLVVVPLGAEVVELNCITNGLGTSVTLQLGDSGDVDRYMVATAFAVAEASGKLAFAGTRFRATADTVVFGRYAGAAPTVGTIFRGTLWVVPGA